MQALTHLKKINLFNNPSLEINDYKAINNMLNLESLILTNSLNFNIYLKELTGLRKLKKLDLGGCKNLSEEDIAIIISLNEIEEFKYC